MIGDLAHRIENQSIINNTSDNREHLQMFSYIYLI